MGDIIPVPVLNTRIFINPGQIFRGLPGCQTVNLLTSSRPESENRKVIIRPPCSPFCAMAFKTGYTSGTPL